MISLTVDTQVDILIEEVVEGTSEMYSVNVDYSSLRSRPLFG